MMKSNSGGALLIWITTLSFALIVNLALDNHLIGLEYNKLPH